MAKAKGTPFGGVDRWTSNGKGIKVTKTPLTKDQIAKIEKEASKKGKK